MKIINLEKARKEFVRYVDHFDLNIEMIALKKYHSLRVMEVAEKIAESEKFSEEEIELATLIGLLHDIARFKQYTEYKTFKDAQSFDHGDMGVEILEKENFIRNFIKTDKYDETIKIAIKNHNKFSVEEGLTDTQNKFCELIRDADKIDIIFQKTEKITDSEKEIIESSKLDLELKEEFDKGHLINRKKYTKQKGEADQIIGVLALIFDINFKKSFEIIYKENYVNKIIDRFKFKDEYTKKAMEEAKNRLNQYILNKIEK